MGKLSAGVLKVLQDPSLALTSDSLDPVELTKTCCRGVGTRPHVRSFHLSVLKRTLVWESPDKKQPAECLVALGRVVHVALWSEVSSLKSLDKAQYGVEVKWIGAPSPQRLCVSAADQVVFGNFVTALAVLVDPQAAIEAWVKNKPSDSPRKGQELACSSLLSIKMAEKHKDTLTELFSGEESRQVAVVTKLRQSRGGDNSTLDEEVMDELCALPICALLFLMLKTPSFNPSGKQDALALLADVASGQERHVTTLIALKAHSAFLEACKGTGTSTQRSRGQGARGVASMAAHSADCRNMLLQKNPQILETLGESAMESLQIWKSSRDARKQDGSSTTTEEVDGRGCAEESLRAIRAITSHRTDRLDYKSFLEPLYPLCAKILSLNTGFVSVEAMILLLLGEATDGEDMRQTDFVSTPKLPELLLEKIKAGIEEEESGAITGNTDSLHEGDDGESKRLLPALRVLGHILSGDHAATQVMLQAGALPCLIGASGLYNPILRKEACWALSNICAGTAEQVKDLLQQGGLPCLLERSSRTQETEKDVRNEAIWALANAVEQCDQEETLEELTKAGVLSRLSDALYPIASISQASQIITVLSTVLALGERKKEASGAQENSYAKVISEAGGVNQLRSLEAADDEEIPPTIKAAAREVLDRYFINGTGAKRDSVAQSILSDICREVGQAWREEQAGYLATAA